MSSPKLTVVLTLVLVLALAAAAAADSRKFGCNTGGRVFEYTPVYGSAMDITLMWTNPNADNDIAVYRVDTGDFVGVGQAVTPRFETVTLGAQAGLGYQILVFKFSGPNSQCVLDVSIRDGGVSVPSSSVARLRYRGRIGDLAARDPRFERVLEAFERFRQEKRSPAED